MESTAYVDMSTPMPPRGPSPDEIPIRGFFAVLEALIREPRRVMVQLSGARAGALVRTMFIAAAICYILYGAVAGTYARGTQLWAAPVKIAGGLVFSALICLPS